MIRLEGDSLRLTLTQHTGFTFGSLLFLHETEKKKSDNNMEF